MGWLFAIVLFFALLVALGAAWYVFVIAAVALLAILLLAFVLSIDVWPG